MPPYGYVPGPLLSQGPEFRWVIHWKDHQEIFESFGAAQIDFLDFLWFWGDELHQADTDLYEEIMKAWESARRWRAPYYEEQAPPTHFAVIVKGEQYGMTRLDVWEGRG